MMPKMVVVEVRRYRVFGDTYFIGRENGRKREI
jgi:hypothetical protein